MSDFIVHQPDPRLDLLLERVVDVPRHLVWAAWTQPELIRQWFTPKPWRTTEVELDLRPGGRFRTVMQGPEGPAMDNTGCVLEVVEGRKFAWTGALGPGFRPRARDFQAPFLMSAVISLDDEGAGTRYRALVIHGDEPARAQHAAMGFEAGWGTALDQLVALARTL
jgi:uncharacterized protein YndB with AHSA1/START domain